MFSTKGLQSRGQQLNCSQPPGKILHLSLIAPLTGKLLYWTSALIKSLRLSQPSSGKLHIHSSGYTNLFNIAHAVQCRLPLGNHFQLVMQAFDLTLCEVFTYKTPALHALLMFNHAVGLLPPPMTHPVVQDQDVHPSHWCTSLWGQPIDLQDETVRKEHQLLDPLFRKNLFYLNGLRLLPFRWKNVPSAWVLAVGTVLFQDTKHAAALHCVFVQSHHANNSILLFYVK